MAISPATLGAAALAQRRKPPPRTPLDPDALKAAAQARKAAILGDASKARSSPVFQLNDSRKSQARAKLQQLGEWLKIVKKLYAQNPQGMAKALAQAFKELKAAVAAYKDAGGEEMTAVGGAVDAVIALAPSAAGAEMDGEGAGGGKTDAAADPREVLVAPPDGHARYDAVVGEVRKMIGEDGLDFLRSVRSLVDDLRDLLETARGQAAIRKRDKETDRAFEDADTALKDLGAVMSGMEQQIHSDAPLAGMTLSVAA